MATMEQFLRGAELFQHRFAMSLKAILSIGIVSAATGLIITLSLLFILTTPLERQILGYNRVAAIEIFLGLGDMRTLSRVLDVASLSPLKMTPKQIIDVTDKSYREKISMPLMISLLSGFVVSLITAYFIVLFYRRKGMSMGTDKHLRGAQLVDANELKRQIETGTPGAGNYSIVGVPLPRGMEMRNILMTGSMGVGKSVAIFDLMDQVFAANKKAVIYDKTGEFVSLYFRPGKDFILNPFDFRFPGWNFFSEIEEVYGFDQMAHSLIPESEKPSGNEKYFQGGARTLFAEVLSKIWRVGDRRMSTALNMLLKSSLSELAEFTEGTRAAAYMNPKAETQSGGVLSQLIGSLWFMSYVKEGDFCIKDWVRCDDDSRLFISSHESVHAVILPLITLFLDLVFRAVMTLPTTRQDRLWIFLDEFGSLNSLPIVKTSLTEGRKYGAVHVIGAQNKAQFISAYGKDTAQTLIANMQTQLILRVSDEETAEAYSKFLGSADVDEKSDSISFGAESGRDSGTISSGRKERRLVLASEIKTLPDCTGYLQVAGPYSVAKVSYKPKDREPTNFGFIKRDELMLSNQPAIAAKKADNGDADSSITTEVENEPLEKNSDKALDFTF